MLFCLIVSTNLRTVATSPFALVNSLRGLSTCFLKALAIDRDREYEDPMANITYPDVDRLTFWGVPYQFDYVFGPGTQQAQARESLNDPKIGAYSLCRTELRPSRIN